MDRLEIILKRKGLKKAELADLLNISRRALTKRLNNPTLASIKEMAKVLDVELHELFEVGDNYSHMELKDGWHGIKKIK